MSIRVPLNELSEGDRNIILKQLCFEKKANTLFNMASKEVYPYEIVDEGNNVFVVYLPMNWAIKYIPATKKYIPGRKDFRQNNTIFKGTLRPLQEDVQKSAINLLNKQKSCIISLYTGAGKTITSIYISTKIKLPTLILVHRLVLMDQWKESIERVCENPKIQIVKTSSMLDKEADYYIMNISNVKKKSREFYKGVGLLIVDEMHVTGTENLSNSFLFVCPRYCIGLSATPYRPDGMDELLYAFFGDKKIHKQLNREHIVYKVKSDFTPEKRLMRNGKVEWNSIIESQTSSAERNEIIINIIKTFHDRTFLILSKRVLQVEYLMKRLLEEDIDATSLVGVKKHFNYDSRVLVATVQKAGVGFDHPKLDTLIIASDVEEYFIQYLGRVFRTQHTIPMIFDIVDNNSILTSHYYTRRKIYIKHGGIVKNLTETNVDPQYTKNFQQYLK